MIDNQNMGKLYFRGNPGESQQVGVKTRPDKNHSTIFDDGAVKASPSAGKRMMKTSSSGLQLVGGYGNDVKNEANVKAYSRHSIAKPRI